MSEAIKHPEKVYGAILAKEGAGIAFHTDIKYDLPHLKDAFNRAANGEEVVDNNLTDELVGGKTGLTRSNPVDDVKHDYGPDFEPVLRLIQTRAVVRSLTPEENQALETGIKDLAKKTGVNESFLRYELDDDEKTLHKKEANLDDKFGNSCSVLNHDIGEELKRRVRLGSLPADEDQKLRQNLSQYALQNNLSQEQVDAHVADFEKLVKDTDSSNLSDALNAESRLMNRVLKTDGTYYGANDDKTEDYLAIPRFEMDELNRYRAVPFNTKDLPHRVPYFTIQQSEFLTALHEAEHATALAGRHPVVPDDYPEELKEQAHEIDADGPVIKFLNDTGDQKGKDYWLQWRNVDSFADGLSDNFDHDTATFLRVLEKTGRQIDLAEFRKEKSDLMDKLNERLDSEKAKTGDIMGAVNDLLKEDRRHPEKNLLSPLQRAEAEQYIEDAKALGFKANSHYPRPPEEEAEAPEPKKQEPAPAPAATIPSV
jgi:hypothetical protein